MRVPPVVLEARTPEIAEWITQCARGELLFAELCQRVAARGYQTTSLFEMVRAAERQLKDPE